ncbi:Mov34/MPN/PAD-1 family protein [bacterium]|nr:Mov34/MPN/PAD-1 family protein [bacterium]
MQQSSTGPAVFVLETALADVNSHAAEEPEHEIGGILVGSVIDGPRPVVLVEAAIRGHAMAHSRGSVTFTHETWNEINAVKDNEYPDLKIVGWYHSHPGFGLFLSGHDLFIHQNFFNTPWQVAVVADPLAKSWGCFTWHGQELSQEPDVHTVAVQWAAAGAPQSASAAPAPQPAPIIIPAPAPDVPTRGITWALGLIGLLLALLIGVSLATYNDVRVLKGQVAGLNEQVSGMSHELTAIRDRVLDLSQAEQGHEASSPSPAPEAAPQSGPSGPSPPPAASEPPPTTPGAPSP